MDVTNKYCLQSFGVDDKNFVPEDELQMSEEYLPAADNMSACEIATEGQVVPCHNTVTNFSGLNEAVVNQERDCLTVPRIPVDKKLAGSSEKQTQFGEDSLKNDYECLQKQDQQLNEFFQTKEGRVFKYNLKHKFVVKRNE